MASFLLFAAKHALSAGKAQEKVEALEQVLTRYYPGWQPYDGKSEIGDVQIALAYTVRKKGSKAARKRGQAAASLTFGAAGAAIGGAAGTVALPGAGSALGAVTVGSIVGAVPTAGIHLYRKTKAIYKLATGKLGKNRTAAATALFNGTTSLDPNGTDVKAAAAGIFIIVDGDEEVFEAIMLEKKKGDAVDYIAGRLKSW